MHISAIRTQCEELRQFVETDPDMARPQQHYMKRVVELLDALVREVDLLHDRFEMLRQRTG